MVWGNTERWLWSAEQLHWRTTGRKAQGQGLLPLLPQHHTWTSARACPSCSSHLNPQPGPGGPSVRGSPLTSATSCGESSKADNEIALCCLLVTSISQTLLYILTQYSLWRRENFLLTSLGSWFSYINSFAGAKNLLSLPTPLPALSSFQVLWHIPTT